MDHLCVTNRLEHTEFWDDTLGSRRPFPMLGISLKLRGGPSLLISRVLFILVRMILNHHYLILLLLFYPNNYYPSHSIFYPQVAYIPHHISASNSAALLRSSFSEQWLQRRHKIHLHLPSQQSPTVESSRRRSGARKSKTKR